VTARLSFHGAFVDELRLWSFNRVLLAAAAAAR